MTEDEDHPPHQRQDEPVISNLDEGQLGGLSYSSQISKNELMLLRHLKESLISMHLNGGKSDLQSLSGLSQQDIFKAY